MFSDSKANTLHFVLNSKLRQHFSSMQTKSWRANSQFFTIDRYPVTDGCNSNGYNIGEVIPHRR